MATLTLEPNGVGDETAIPNLVGAATHWQAVLTNDGDTSYVEVPNDDEDWHRDLYTLVNSPALGTIDSVTLRVVGRNGQPLWPFPCGCLKFSLKTHEIVYDSETKLLPSYAYGLESNTYATNPNTGDPWTWDEINALQAGLSLHRTHLFIPGGYFWARCTQVYVVVTYTPAPVVAPTVTTDPATEVSILNGTLDDDGGETCDCGFEWGETIAYGNFTATQSKETGETFAHLLGELSPTTTYHFRAFAANSKGTSYGSDQSFTTPAGLPILTTEAASAIGLNGATLNGALTSDGGEPCYCGFEWGETIAYSTTTPTQRKVTGEVFSQPLLHLGEAAQYHFRAFATNSAGTAYGEDRTIDTLFRTNKAYALARYEV